MLIQTARSFQIPSIDGGQKQGGAARCVGGVGRAYWQWGGGVMPKKNSTQMQQISHGRGRFVGYNPPPVLFAGSDPGSSRWVVCLHYLPRELHRIWWS